MLSKAEQILLEGVRAGDAHTWQQFVTRYQGRLTTYAVRSLNGKVSDAEDLVQDVFIAFLKNIDTFEGRSSLESWLFMILRRRMIDMFRRKSSDKLCLVNDMLGDSSGGVSDSSAEYVLPGQVDDMTASRYVRNNEDVSSLQGILTEGFGQLINNLKQKQNFRDLKIIELVFYAGLGNKQISGLLDVDANTIGVIRHRCVDKLRAFLSERTRDIELPALDGILQELWLANRFTCPKRSTIGSWRLGSLDEQWSEYVRFHIETLGCTICMANLQDLDNSLKEKQQSEAVCQRIYESSIGFLN